ERVGARRPKSRRRRARTVISPYRRCVMNPTPQVIWTTRGVAMRLIANSLFTLAATAISSAGAPAAEIEAASKVDAVTVYPDAAIVTRVAEVDLSQADNVLVFKDLPLALD